jgi:hypothetical protein
MWRSKRPSVDEFSERDNNGSIREYEFDEYFLYDHAVSEPGRHVHDLLLREALSVLDTIDLRSLYKYKVDTVASTRRAFSDELELVDFDHAPFLLSIVA